MDEENESWILEQDEQRDDHESSKDRNENGNQDSIEDDGYQMCYVKEEPSFRNEEEEERLDGGLQSLTDQVADNATRLTQATHRTPIKRSTPAESSTQSAQKRVTAWKITSVSAPLIDSISPARPAKRQRKSLLSKKRMACNISETESAEEEDERRECQGILLNMVDMGKRAAAFLQKMNSPHAESPLYQTTPDISLMGASLHHSPSTCSPPGLPDTLQKTTPNTLPIDPSSHLSPCKNSHHRLTEGSQNTAPNLPDSPPHNSSVADLVSLPSPSTSTSSCSQPQPPDVAYNSVTISPQPSTLTVTVPAAEFSAMQEKLRKHDKEIRELQNLVTQLSTTLQRQRGVNVSAHSWSRIENRLEEKTQPSGVKVLRIKEEYKNTMLQYVPDHKDIARRLVKGLFLESERIGADVRGVRGHRMDIQRMEAIHDAVFELCPSVEEFKNDIWQKCVTAINDQNRNIERRVRRLKKT